MKKVLFVFAIVFIATQIIAQKANQKANQKNEIRIPIKTESWTSKENRTAFVDHKGVPSFEMNSGSELMTAKDVTFTNGTLEFDMDLKEGFAGCYFHFENENNSELVYLRDVPDPTKSVGAIQYAPIIKGVNMWDMMYHYQTGANFKKGEWTHFKFVISGSQMLVYVNDMSRPTLEIPRLEGDTTTGGIAFNGNCFIANVVLKPNETAGLSPNAGFDPTNYDIRYMRNWQVSEPEPLPLGQELNNSELPDIRTKWQQVSAERMGLINLSRIYGNSSARRYVWLRTKITATKEVKRKIDFGFSDEVWVFLNDALTYADKSLYGQGMRKKPDGRISIDNSSFEITLKEGQNDLLIGLSNDFYGWGIIARLDDLEGLQLSTDYKEESINPEFEQYFGTYASKTMPLKIKVTQKNEKLSAMALGQRPILMDPSGKDTFKFDQYGIVIEFVPAEKKMTLKEGGQAIELLKE